jgi:hypothetical protein
VTSREERDRRRQERLEAEKRSAAAERRKMVLGYAVAGALSLAVVVGVVIVISSSGDSSGQVSGEDLPEAAHIVVDTGFVHDAVPDDREGTTPPPVQQGDLTAAAREAGCELRLDLEEEGNNHVGLDQKPDWKTNPPTSGDHHAEQQADGAYTEVNEMHTLHALEHGRVEIQYSPDLPEEDQLALKGVFDAEPAGTLFFPDPDMPYEVAATAWTQLIGCEKYEGQATLDAIRAFRATYLGRGPENFAITVPG